MKEKLSFLYEPKSKIGWVHGSLACVCALLCAYLTMMNSTLFLEGDYAQRIIPSIVLTPILISVYGLWFLFVSNYITLIKRFILVFVLLLFLMILASKL